LQMLHLILVVTLTGKFLTYRKWAKTDVKTVQLSFIVSLKVTCSKSF
jgi:hypothetical protein